MKKLSILSLVISMLLFLILSSPMGAQTSLKEAVDGLNMAPSTISQENKVVEIDFEENTGIETKYLGTLQKANDKDFFVFNTIIVENKNGLSPRNLNLVMFYSENKEFIGYYYLNLTSQLPKEIFKNQLVFKDPCTGKDVMISFTEGIPRDINLGCIDDPDFYKFIGAK